MRVSAFAAFIVVAALASVSCTKDSAVPADSGVAADTVGLIATTDTVPVTIFITCYPDSVVARIRPSVIQVTAPALVAWVLDPASTVSEFSIDKKKNSNKKWPYGGTLPYKGTKDEAAKGDRIYHEPPGTYKYGYSITALCTPADGPIKEITIDPDIIIIWN